MKTLFRAALSALMVTGFSAPQSPANAHQSAEQQPSSVCLQTKQAIETAEKEMSFLYALNLVERGATRALVRTNQIQVLMDQSTANITQLGAAGCEPYGRPISFQTFGGSAFLCVERRIWEDLYQPDPRFGIPAPTPTKPAPPANACERSTWDPTLPSPF